MNKRRDHLKALFGGGPLPGEDAPSPSPQTNRAPETKSFPSPTKANPPRSASGAVKAMGLTLDGVTRDIDEARAIRESLARGEHVVAIDPMLIDPSPVRDRLSGEETGEEGFEALVESVRENGQQVPVLLRPHPEKAGRYQVAYGHRRVRAAARLATPVQAVVRQLADEELVLAQGKENSERRNLSFIERAFFARSLIDHGFDRAIAQRALSVHKADITRLLAVADAVPERVARGIGPAPKAGRERWMALAEYLQRESAAVIADDLVTSESFLKLPTDERFRSLFERVARLSRSPQSGKTAPRQIADEKGRVLARLSEGKKPKLEFDEKVEPGLARYIAERLPELAARFAEEKAHETD
ncbi:plasmid partitioning protein RepB [Chelativorans salis]|uniref:Plasmid partitioning protein RepB n=1 Tax=Chelativorans salis TaxID=2978478 RepID=A0ABT2LTX9_9HYPH|nr:plasmid partitioning protein RepB [Chelativorans sp. EGI FJ00035]MCT7377991.1 plasmid partitioning protein RepB [Chelativorans sp. EGI FJ00035]